MRDRDHSGLPPTRRGLARSKELRNWMFEAALPYWAESGVDRVQGGFVEYLGLDGRDGRAPFKRVRAQCRQIYVFAHAALLGWREGAEFAEHGWSFLTRHGRRADGAWVRQLGREGGVLDATCDAYDMAFALFAHAWMFRLTGDQAVARSARDTISVLDGLLGHPNGLGWRAYEGADGPREQNPHMHLMEAAIELADATKDAFFHEFAEKILRLFMGRIIEDEGRLLREFYADDWSRPASDQGNIVEPGHMLEWSWILNHAKSLLGLEVADVPHRLYEGAMRLGQRSSGALIMDQVDPSGRAILASCRLWPQTEALKAHLSQFEAGDTLALDSADKCAQSILDLYLDYEPYGCWIDQLDRDLRPDITRIPSTSFYHIFLAFSEALRVAP